MGRASEVSGARVKGWVLQLVVVAVVVVIHWSGPLLPASRLIARRLWAADSQKFSSQCAPTRVPSKTTATTTTQQPQQPKLTTRHDAPKTLAGRLTRNFVLTTPEFPCGRVTRLGVRIVQIIPCRGTHPQMTRTLEPLISRLAL